VDSLEEKTFRLLEDVIFLKKTVLFSSMQTSELRAIAAIANELYFENGKEIVRENDVGDSLYIIKDGSVKIVKSIHDKQSIKLAELTKGDCFGEMALFDAELRSASVYAKEPCTLICINRDDLNDLLLDYPTIGVEFLKIFVKRLRKANDKIEKLSVSDAG
jgi:CRP-like cAMP-binding protein